MLQGHRRVATPWQISMSAKLSGFWVSRLCTNWALFGGIHSELTFKRYLIGQGLGGLLFSPCSEAFGRKRLYIAFAFLYAIFCVPVAATPNIAAVFIGRFITGVLSSVPSLVIRGSIKDLLHTEIRTWGFFVWSMVTNLGLVLGPVFACYVAVALNWYVSSHLISFSPSALIGVFLS